MAAHEKNVEIQGYGFKHYKLLPDANGILADIDEEKFVQRESTGTKFSPCKAGSTLTEKHPTTTSRPEGAVWKQS